MLRENDHGPEHGWRKPEMKQWRFQDFPWEGGGGNSQSGYANLLFCRNLHENERIWIIREGARVPSAPWIRHFRRSLSVNYK